MTAHPTLTVLRPGRRQFSTPVAVSAAVLSGVSIGGLASFGVSAIAHAAGVSHSFRPLMVGTFLALIVLGVLGGVTGWQVVRARAQHPGQLLRTLVPAVLLASLLPDVLLGVSGSMGATWGAVAALMTMHVVVAAAAVTSYLIFLPIGGSTDLPPARSA